MFQTSFAIHKVLGLFRDRLLLLLLEDNLAAKDRKNELKFSEQIWKTEMTVRDKLFFFNLGFVWQKC